MSPSDLAGLTRTDNASGPRSDALDVAIDEALIAPEGWQSVDLWPLDATAGHNAPLVVTARFGLQAIPAGNDNPAETQGKLPPAGAMFLSSAGVANDDFVLPPLTDVTVSPAPAPAPAPRRVRRLVRVEAVEEIGEEAARRPDLLMDVAAARAAADAEPAVQYTPEVAAPYAPGVRHIMPMPVQAAVDWQGMRRALPSRKQQGLDRSSLRSLFVIMIMAWLLVLALGTAKLSNPASGAKIVWDN